MSWQQYWLAMNGMVMPTPYFPQMTVYSQMIIPNQNQMLNVGIAGGASKLPQLPPQGGARGAQGQSEGQSELKMETERSTVLLDSS